MTNNQILKGAIEKAMKNGYMPIEYKGKEVFDYITISGLGVTFWKRTKWNRKKEYPKCGTVLNVYSIIFSHDFAKAFWGEGIQWFCRNCGHLEPIEVTYQEQCSHCSFSADSLTVWTFYLQQMVLEPEPLKYLEKFLGGTE